MVNILKSQQTRKREDQLKSIGTKLNDFSAPKSNPITSDPIQRPMVNSGVAPLVDPVKTVRPVIDFASNPTEYDMLQQSQFDQSQKTKTRDQLRREATRGVQNELSAINDSYFDLRLGLQQEGQNDVGRTIARSRNLGSGARFELERQAKDANFAKLESLGVRRNERIASVESQANEMAQNERLIMEQAKRAGATAYTAYLQDKQTRDSERANSVVTSLLATDTTPDDLTDEEVNAIAKAANLSPEEVRLQYESGFQAIQEEKKVIADEKAKALSDYKNKLMLEAAGSGATSQDIDRILAATDEGTAASIASAFIGGERAQEIKFERDQAQAKTDRAIFESDRSFGMESDKFNFDKQQSGFDNQLNAAKEGLTFDSASGGLTIQSQSNNLFSDQSFKPAQELAAGFATRIEDTSSTLDKFGAKFTGAFSGLGAFAPNQLKSSDRQQFEQAQRNFINATLRRESGAAIADTEFDSARSQYIPQAGDSAEVIEQKMLNRSRVLASLKSEAGGAYLKQIGQQLKDENPDATEEELIEIYNDVNGISNEVTTITDPIEVVATAAQATGFEGPYMLAMAERESGFDSNAKNPKSTANGLFQFLDATWNESVKQYGGQYGITQADRNKPGAQALLAAEYGKSNARIVFQNTGRTLQGGEHYIPHFLGAGGATTLLNNLGGQSAASLMPEAAKANPSVFYSNGKPLSTQQLYTSLVTDINRRANKYT